MEILSKGLITKRKPIECSEPSLIYLFILAIHLSYVPDNSHTASRNDASIDVRVMLGLLERSPCGDLNFSQLCL